MRRILIAAAVAACALALPTLAVPAPHSTCKIKIEEGRATISGCAFGRGKMELEIK